MILYIFFKISARNYKELRATPLTPWLYLKSLDDFIIYIFLYKLI